MNEVIYSMNGALWVFATLLILMVVVQALLFLRHALKFNEKNKLLTKDEIKSAIRTGSVSVIGPSISAIVVALSLIVMVGSAVTFMRCGVIGAPSWELFMADIAAKASGTSFDSLDFTKEVFVLCIFGMTFASAPYFINTIITLKPLDLAINKAKKVGKEKKKSFLPMLGDASKMAIIGWFILDYSKTPQQKVALVVAGSLSIIFIALSKAGHKWLGDWNMALSILIGMAVGQIVQNFM